MKAAIYKGPYELEVGQRPDPKLQEPTDALVRVVLGSVCGSDLWYYRGQSPHALGPIGHEYIGVIEDVGADVRSLTKGDLVVAPFTFCDGSCAICRAGWPSNCLNGGSFGNHGIDGGQGEAVRSHSPTRPSSRSPVRATPTDAEVPAELLRRHVHGSPRRDQRRGEAG